MPKAARGSGSRNENEGLAARLDIQISIHKNVSGLIRELSRPLPYSRAIDTPLKARQLSGGLQSRLRPGAVGLSFRFLINNHRQSPGADACFSILRHLTVSCSVTPCSSVTSLLAFAHLNSRSVVQRPPPTTLNSPLDRRNHSAWPPPRRPWCGQTPEDELRFTPRNVLLTQCLSSRISVHIRKTATGIFRVTLICQLLSFLFF